MRPLTAFRLLLTAVLATVTLRAGEVATTTPQTPATPYPPPAAHISPFQLSFAAPYGQMVPATWSIHGLRIGALSTENRTVGPLDITVLSNKTTDLEYGIQFAGYQNEVDGDTYGIQLVGLFNRDHGDMAGFQFAGAGNFVDGDAYGLQIGGFSNRVNGETMAYLLQISVCNNEAGTLRGMQIGLYNHAKVAQGVQIGVMNVADDLDGLQLGLFNTNRASTSVPHMILLNIGF